MDISNTQEENTLEQSLELAAKEPARRPDFFKTLLNSTVYVPGSTGAGKGHIDLEAGSQISIVHWEKQDGTAVIPFFTSLQTLEQSIARGESYLEIPARSLFEMTRGTPLFLEPKSPYGKEFLPEEVQNLLSAEMGRTTQRTLEKDAHVQLGQPAQYPTRMVNALTPLFARHRNIKRGFLALMYNVTTDEKPHLVVGIEADGDIELILREASQVARDTAPDGEDVGLYRIQEGEQDLSDYFFTQTTPFYQRTLGSKLRSLFGFG